MVRAGPQGVQRWGRPRARFWTLLLAIALPGALSACAGEGVRVKLQVPTPLPLHGPPGSPRLAVRPLRDVREPELLKSREGWFLEYLPDEALEPHPALAVTQALVERLRASARFQEVLRLASDDGVTEPFSPPPNPVPAELILEGDLLAFYAERNTVTHPFISLLAVPLGLPLAALTGLKLLPTPITPLLPVDYRANLTFQVRLRDAQTDTVVWERMVEAIGEHRETTGTDFFQGRETLMGETASLALRSGIEKLARLLPPPDWFRARWPRRPIPAPRLPAEAPQ